MTLCSFLSFSRLSVLRMIWIDTMHVNSYHAANATRNIAREQETETVPPA